MTKGEIRAIIDSCLDKIKETQEQLEKVEGEIMTDPRETGRAPSDNERRVEDAISLIGEAWENLNMWDYEIGG